MHKKKKESHRDDETLVNFNIKFLRELQTFLIRHW